MLIKQNENPGNRLQTGDLGFSPFFVFYDKFIRQSRLWQVGSFTTLYSGLYSYFVDTVGKNAKKIEEYIKNQLQEDMVADQISMAEYIDPFTGERVEKSKK